MSCEMDKNFLLFLPQPLFFTGLVNVFQESGTILMTFSSVVSIGFSGCVNIPVLLENFSFSISTTHEAFFYNQRHVGKLRKCLLSYYTRLVFW